ncbi:carboxymuconolactone decarboxylase family protein [Actinoplanes sp. NPDC026619]|uniref:carboxymuconolactone decarboxylase family protein n=1 Tax=Actinoplanes sp. NPDC026619 TaxID=3155798 RepID=UPI0033BFE6CB
MSALDDLDPEFAAAYRELAAVSARGGALEPKVRAFIGLAVAVSCTHRHGESARARVADAYAHGATTTELIGVCELAMLLGVHTMTLAGPILAEEMAAAGHPLPDELTPAQQEIRQRYVADRGALPPPLEPVLRLDPDYIDAYRRMSALPARRADLPPVVVELIVIALDAATTHLYAPGTRAHIRNALALGASPAQILAALEIASTLAVSGTLLGFEAIDGLRRTSDHRRP